MLTIHDVIDTSQVRSLFQPIVHLGTGTVAGFEALSRGPANTPLELPAALLAEARRVGRLAELDWVCRVSAMQAATVSGLHASLSWFINVEPASLETPCPDRLAAALSQARSDLRVVLEVVERGAQGHVTDLVLATDQARSDAWGVALDHVGAEPGSLALLPFLQPDVVKLDMSLVRTVPDSAVSEVTAAVRHYADRTGAVILAEGIETEQHERLARVFGATFAQGYRYGPPAPLPTDVPAPRNVIPLKQRPAPLEGLTPFDQLRSARNPQRASRGDTAHIWEYIEELALATPGPTVLLVRLDHPDELSAARLARYQSLESQNALTVVLAPGLEPLITSRLHIGAPSSVRNRAGERTIILMGPQRAAAFAAQDEDHTGPEVSRRHNFIYTQDPSRVAAAGRAFLQDLTDSDRSPHRQAPLGSSAPHAGTEPIAEKSRKALFRRRTTSGGR